MTIFKRSLLLSTTFLLGIHTCWGMDNDENPLQEEKGKLTKKAPSSSQKRTEDDDKDFMPMGELGDVLNDLNVERQIIQNQNKKTIDLSFKSVPLKLAKKEKKSNANDSFSTPINKEIKKEIKSAPPPIKKKTTEEIYESHVKISEKFLKLEKREFISKKAHLLFIDFINNYIFGRESTLDVTDLSARSRIYLLNSILNFKLNFLPSYASIKNHKQFKEWEYKAKDNNFWEKEKTPPNKIAEFTDKVPTTFKIGKFSYRLQQGPTFYQKGSGKLFGLLPINAPDTYKTINKKLREYDKKKIEEFSSLLLKQKKDGNPIDTKNVIDDQFFNGLNLLLDYEVARRLAKDDKFAKFPIISYVEFIINHLHDRFQDLVVGKKTSEWGISTPYDNELSLVTGDDRHIVAQKVIPELNFTESSAQIRRALAYMHSFEEDSDDSYSGDEEDFSIPKMPSLDNQDLEDEFPDGQDEEGKKEVFLDNISHRYISMLRSTNPQETLWGGDIELDAIATLYNLRIIVHEPGYEDGRVVGPQRGRPINLWLENGHYQNYNPKTKKKRNTPPDGHCLFHAVLRAISNSSTIKDVSNMRNKVAEHFENLIENINNREEVEREGTEKTGWNPITVRLTPNDNPIYVRFAAIFEAINERQLRDAVLDLPPGQLRDEAVQLRRKYNSSNNQNNKKNDKKTRTLSVTNHEQYLSNMVDQDMISDMEDPKILGLTNEQVIQIEKGTHYINWRYPL